MNGRTDKRISQRVKTNTTDPAYFTFVVIRGSWTLLPPIGFELLRNYKCKLLDNFPSRIYVTQLFCNFALLCWCMVCILKYLLFHATTYYTLLYCTIQYNRKWTVFSTIQYFTKYSVASYSVLHCTVLYCIIWVYATVCIAITYSPPHC